MSHNLSLSLIFAASLSLFAGFLCLKLRALSKTVSEADLSAKRAKEEMWEHLQKVKLHLQRHEELLKHLDQERISPLAKTIVQLHQDQRDLLLYTSKIFSDLNFGTDFTKNGTRA